jgi:hypothetical protein
LEELASSDHVAYIVIDIGFDFDNLPGFLLESLSEVAEDEGFVEELVGALDEDELQGVHLRTPWGCWVGFYCLLGGGGR